MPTRTANEVMLHAVKLALCDSFDLLTREALTFGAVIATAEQQLLTLLL